MAINTQIPEGEWGNFFATFSNGNRGRQLALEVIDADASGTGVARQGPLLSVAYDPAGKGDDIVVSTGVDEVEYAHTIHQPIEVWRAQRDDGEIAALEIIDQEGAKTILTFG